jgi:nucleoside phosphorylase
MGLIQRDVGVAIGATAAALSPRARRAVRRGAVYGLAGALKVGDVVAATARGAAQGTQTLSSDAESGQAPERRQAARKKPASRTVK